tara:strand:+ start:6465 stop:7157 length:693 start_codon:yes stop_codon:yes gene_type:complete
MDEIGLKELLQLVINDKGGSPQQYRELMDYIAYHETGQEQRMDPKAVQITDDGKKEGFGRGLFMYEAGEGNSGNSAANRLHAYLQSKNLPSPQWLLDIKGYQKNVDASKLNADQQKMLFLGDHRMREGSNFSKIWSGEQDLTEFWAYSHWKGKNPTQEQIEEKMNLFDANMTHKDSTDAIKELRQEEMYKKNMAPYLSLQNQTLKLPSEKTITELIFGNDTSAIINRLKQ